MTEAETNTEEVSLGRYPLVQQRGFSHHQSTFKIG